MTDDVGNEHTLYEIIELNDGEIGLCRAGDNGPEGEPLVVVRFSEESRYFLGKACGNIAKVMIEAGLGAVEDIQDQNAESVSSVETKTHMVH